MRELVEEPSSVLTRGIGDQPLLWEQEGFAVALLYDGRYRGLKLASDGDLSQVTDAMLLVKPQLAVAQRAEGRPTKPEDRSDDTPFEKREDVPPDQPKVDYFFGTKVLDATHYAMDFKRLMEEVLQHLSATPGIDLKVRIEIEAEAPGGFSEFQVRTVKENSHALKFDQAGFEERH